MYLIPPPLLPPKLPAEFLKLRDDPGALYASEARLEEIRCTLDAEFSTIAAKEAHLHYILAHLSSVKQNFNNAIEHIRNLSIQRAALHVQLVREEEYKFSTPHKRRRDLSDDLDDDKAASTSSGSSPDRFFRSNIRQCIRRVGPTELTPIQPCLPDIALHLSPSLKSSYRRSLDILVKFDKTTAPFSNFLHSDHPSHSSDVTFAENLFEESIPLLSLPSPKSSKSLPHPSPIIPGLINFSTEVTANETHPTLEPHPFLSPTIIVTNDQGFNVYHSEHEKQGPTCPTMLDIEPASPSPLYTMQDDLGAALLDLGTSPKTIPTIQVSIMKENVVRHFKEMKTSKLPKRWEPPIPESEERRAKRLSRRNDPLGKNVRRRKIDAEHERYGTQAEDMLQKIFFEFGLTDISTKLGSWKPFA